MWRRTSSFVSKQDPSATVECLRMCEELEHVSHEFGGFDCVFSFRVGSCANVSVWKSVFCLHTMTLPVLKAVSCLHMATLHVFEMMCFASWFGIAMQYILSSR